MRWAFVSFCNGSLWCHRKPPQQLPTARGGMASSRWMADPWRWWSQSPSSTRWVGIIPSAASCYWARPYTSPCTKTAQVPCNTHACCFNDCSVPTILHFQLLEPVLLLGKERFAGVDIRVRVKGGGHVAQIYGKQEVIRLIIVSVDFCLFFSLCLKC